MRTLLTYWAGFMTCALFVYALSYSPASIPLDDGFVTYTNQAPSDWVSQEDVYLTNNQVILNIKGASLSEYAPTGSMKPLFDAGANGIRIVPANAAQISIGDIVSFRRGTDLIVHRVIEQGFDEDGRYYITKGDNNLVTDGKIRFSDIEYVTVGVIW